MYFNVLLLVYLLLSFQVNTGKGLVLKTCFNFQPVRCCPVQLPQVAIIPEMRDVPLWDVHHMWWRESDWEELLFLNVTSHVNRISLYYSAGITE